MHDVTVSHLPSRCATMICRHTTVNLHNTHTRFPGAQGSSQGGGAGGGASNPPGLEDEQDDLYS